MEQVVTYNLRQCSFCGEMIDVKRYGFYRRGTGWFKKQKNSQGTNSAALVAWKNDYACKLCIQKKVSGIDVNQMALFVLADDDD